MDLDQAVAHLWFVERLRLSTEGGPVVEVLRWPGDRVEVERVAEADQPRLLVVDPTTTVERAADELEDWVRLPVTDEDVLARLRVLRARAAHRIVRPRLDGTGRLVVGDRSVVLSATEERLAAVLIGRIDGIVPIADLLGAGWGNHPPTRNGWRPSMYRLRRRCDEVGLHITAVRGRGYAVRLGVAPGATPGPAVLTASS